MAEKVKLPKEVAEAIKKLKRDGYTIRGLLGFVINYQQCSPKEARTLDSYANSTSQHLNDVLKAIILNNYEIEPEYVSFEEAMRAIGCGQHGHFHPSEGQSINVHKDCSLTWFNKYTWRQLIEGKWTIEGDSE